MLVADQNPIALPLVFVGAEDVPILYANVFVAQFQQDELLLTVGQVAPPILLGDEGERREQAERLSYVPVKVMARLALTRDRMAELLGVIQDNLAAYDDSQEKKS